MKRILAALLVLSCLLTLPSVFAAPVPEDEAPADSAAETENTSSIKEADGPRPFRDSESISESDGPKPEEDAEKPVDPLDGLTAINRLEVTAVINEDGEAQMTQKIRMNVAGVLETLTFAVPEDADDCEMEGWDPDFSDEDGLQLLTIRSKSGFSGEQTFTLTFSLEDLVTAGEESQKLNLPLMVQQQYPVGQIALAVTLPKLFASAPVFSSGYHGDLIQDYMEINTTENGVTATVNTILQDSASLSMMLTVQDGYFSGSFGAGGGWFLPACTILFALLALLLWWKGIKGPAIHGHSRALPPDGVNPGDLPFLLAGGKADFNMLVSHWATLGYLSFYVNKAGHVVLHRRMSMGNERRKYERRLFELLFGNSDVCDGASIRYHKVGRKAQDVIPRYWYKRLYDRSSMSPALIRGLAHGACGFATAAALNALEANFLFVLLGLVTGCALSVLLHSGFTAFFLNDWLKAGLGAGCGLLLLILGGLGGSTLIMVPAVGISAFVAWRTIHGGRPSAYGQQVLDQTVGFRRFMRSANETHLLQMLQRDPQYFYKNLPYAQAMGLGNNFVNAFHSVRLEPCQWYESPRSVPTSADAFYDRYLDILDMLSISIDG